jgi:hypothetical protein
MSRRDGMTRVITLLNEKNHYLEKFYSLNEAELKNFLQSNFDGLEVFYNSREKILEIIKYIDSQIESERMKDNNQAVAEKYKMEIKQALSAKDQYVERILEQDLQILSCIEAAKNEIIKELKSVKHGRKAMKGYKQPSSNT